MSHNLTEGSRENSLRNLIEPLVSIDQYKSKSGDDKNVCVVAVKVNKQAPAKDLSQFLETGIIDAIDVDISPGPDHSGLYTVFIELERNSKMFDLIDRIFSDITTVDNECTDRQTFTSYENKQPQPWNEENFKASVITSSYDYEIAHNPEAKEIKNRIDFLNKY